MVPTTCEYVNVWGDSTGRRGYLAQSADSLKNMRCLTSLDLVEQRERSVEIDAGPHAAKRDRCDPVPSPFAERSTASQADLKGLIDHCIERLSRLVRRLFERFGQPIINGERCPHGSDTTTVRTGIKASRIRPNGRTDALGCEREANVNSIMSVVVAMLSITGVYLWLRKRRSKTVAQGRRLRPVSVSHG